MLFFSCRPFSIIEGEGFKALATKLISIGARYGKVDDIGQVLPCATTVSRHLGDIVTKEKAKLCRELVSVNQFGVTTDLWTHQHTNDSYVTVTVQYIKDWKLRSCILATRPMNERHTAENVRNAVKGVLEEFSALRPGNVYVSDNASNMKAAFRDNTWFGCACHNLNLVLSHGLQANTSSDSEDGLPQEITELIDICKELVTLAKRTKLNSQLETTLKQCVVTRWNSILTTLKSVSSNLADLQIICISTEDKGNRRLLRLLADIKESLLLEVISVLEPFDTATKCLSADKAPTVHLVVPTKVQLKKSLTAAATDNAITAQMKRHLQQQLEQYYAVGPLHYTATLLDPRLKDNADVLPPAQRAAAVSDLRQLVDAVPHLPIGLQEEEQEEPVPAKRIKLEDSFYGNLFSATATPASGPNEVHM